MNRRQLEHIIRASADIADDDEIIVVGSQSVLGQFPEAPEPLLVSCEADVYPRNRPERADLIDRVHRRGFSFPRHLWVLCPGGWGKPRRSCPTDGNRG